MVVDNRTESDTSLKQPSTTETETETNANEVFPVTVSTIAALIFLGYFIVLPLLVGNTSARINKIYRIIFSLVVSGIYDFGVWEIVKKQTVHSIPFHLGIGRALFVNILCISAGYFIMLLYEAIPLLLLNFSHRGYDTVNSIVFGPSFRIKQYHNYVKRLFNREKVGRRANFEQTSLSELKSYIVTVSNYIFDVFLPQRLLSSVIISIYLTLILSLFIIANLQQFLHHFYKPILESFAFDDPIVYIIYDGIYIGSYLVTFIPFCVILVICLLMIVNFRNKIMKMRRGLYKIDKDAVFIDDAPKFISRQIFLSVFIYIILVVVLFIAAIVIIAMVRFKNIRNSILIFILHIAIVTILVMLIYHLKFFLTREYMDNTFLLQRRIPAFMDAVKRLAYSFLELCFTYPRLDHAVLFDRIHMSFSAILYIDHVYNNPLVHTFISILTQELKKQKGRYLIGQGIGMMGLTSPLLNTAYLPRNRWHIARLLISNPSLIAHRKHNLNKYCNKQKDELNVNNIDLYTNDVVLNA